MLSRKDLPFVPNGDMVLEEGDQLTMVAEERGLAELKAISLENN